MATKKETEQTSEAPVSIYEKLSAIQTRIKAPKKLHNDYGNYYYRNAEGILEALKPYLAEYGLYLTIKDDIVQIGDRYYVKAIVKICDCASESGECIEATALAREDETKKGMDGAQITGAASSYARKYALNALLLLDDTKDADTNEYHKINEKKEEKPEEDPKDILKDLWKKAGGPDEGFEEWFKSKTAEGFTKQAYANMKASLMAQINKKAEEKK